MHQVQLLFRLEAVRRGNITGVRLLFGKPQFRLTLSKVVALDVARDLIHPGPELAFVAEALSIFQYPNEHLLSEVFARRTVTGHAIEKRKQAVMVALEQHTKTFRLSLLDGLHQALVC